MKIKVITVIMALYSIVNESYSSPNGQLLVDIPQLGRIKGSLLTSAESKRNFQAFRGIPYAQPPIGDLRFQVKI